MAEIVVPFDIWWSIWCIKEEAEGYRHSTPSYDPTLDHIYELAQGVLDAIGTGSEAPFTGEGRMKSVENLVGPILADPTRRANVERHLEEARADLEPNTKEN